MSESHRRQVESSKRVFFVLLILLVLVAGFFFVGLTCVLFQMRPPPKPPFPPRPHFPEHNLVFVSFDSMQARHCGHLGHPRKVTPTLDAMADDGITFTRCYSVSSWTLPASMTWFTGMYPSEHKLVNTFRVFNDREQRISNLKELAPDVVTLADVLKANGYATAGFTGNAGVSGGFGYQQGFDVYEHP